MDGISQLDPKRPSIDMAPGSDLVYSWNWSEWLTSAGSNLATVDVVPFGGATVSNIGHEAGVVSCLAALPVDAELGADAGVTCFVVTDSVPPERDSRTIWFDIVTR